MRKTFKKTPTLSLLALMLALIMGYKANAAPLKNIPTKIVQPNGEVIQCYASGDEFFNWLHDKSGLIIIQDKNTGYYSYAKQVNRKLTPSMNIVTTKVINDKTINKAPIKGVTINEVEVPLAEVNKNKDILKSNSKSSPPPNYGVLNNLIVFIRFQDESEFLTQKSVYDDMFNKSDENYSSMKNYFKEVSYNKLTVSSTFYPKSNTNSVASYKDINPRSYYKVKTATNPDGFESPTERIEREHGLLERAIKAIEPQVPKNLNIDMNNDGDVDNVCFVVSGFPEGWNGLLWPHQWSLYSKDVRLNDKKINLFNFQLEASLLEESGVSTLSHEMFHTLGAPDLYHYAYDGIHPASIWDVMEYNLDSPQHMTAYMKYRYGRWIDSIPEITKDGTYILNPLRSPTNNSYKIHSPKSQTEYFVVEYRKPEGVFEQSLMLGKNSSSYNPKRSGLIVYRINTLVDGKGNKNGPPDELYVFRPDGSLKADGDEENAQLSKNENKTEIGGKDNPLFLSDGTDSGIYISEIGSADKTISFKVSVKRETLPYVGWLDTPLNNEIIKGVKDISGWFIYDKEISKVEVLINDKVVGKCNRIARKDVGNSYPGYDVSKCGFAFDLDTTTLTNGTYNLSIRATGIDGTSCDLPSTQVEIKNETLPYVGWIDAPKDGETISGTKNIGGWFIYGKDISKIEVLVDDVKIDDATRYERLDVGTAYPGYNVSKAGFNYTLNADTLKKGSHKIKIRAVSIDKTSQELDLNILKN